MSEVKWIKLYTALPDHRKIKQLRKLPNGDTIALMWIFLLCLAGDTNDDGMVYITKEVPYNDEMLANQFDMDVNTVRIALQAFEQFGMLEIINDMMMISNWEKYQATDRMTEMREYNRIAQQKHREKIRQLQDVNDMSMTCQSCQDIDKDIDKDKEIDIDIDNIDIIDIDKEIRNTKVKKKKYGEYKNVLLTDEEYLKAKTEYPDIYLEYIEKISSYCATSGKTYKNYLAAMREWIKRDQDKPISPKDAGKVVTHKNYTDDPNMQDWMARSQAKLDAIWKEKS